MAYDEVPYRAHRDIPHYHGDAVRGLFVLGAVVLIVAQSTGAELPLSTAGVVIGAAILVIAAGISNPVQKWIHWVNAILSVIGTILFGTAVIEKYRAGVSAFTGSFIFLEALSLISLIALYLSVKTIRGFELRSANE
jgi:hypothetical protein